MRISPRSDISDFVPIGNCGSDPQLPSESDWELRFSFATDPIADPATPRSSGFGTYRNVQTSRLELRIWPRSENRNMLQIGKRNWARSNKTEFRASISGAQAAPCWDQKTQPSSPMQMDLLPFRYADMGPIGKCMCSPDRQISGCYQMHFTNQQVTAR